MKFAASFLALDVAKASSMAYTTARTPFPRASQELDQYEPPA
jgi:hypothetical protein